jgi:hypothetical protein
MAWADSVNHRGWGLFAVGITLLGGLVDWANEAVWAFAAPGWAARAGADAFYAQLYTVWERLYIVLSLGLANLLYTLAGFTLTLCAFRTRHFPRWLAWWTIVIWLMSLALSAVAFAGQEAWITPASAGLFALLLPWFVLVGHGWLAGAHPLPAEADLRERLSLREVARAMIPKHPVPMTTVFRECFLVNFAVQPEVMRRLLPGPIEPDLFEGEAYLSIVIADMEKMRPAFLPRFLGVTYNQVVYRAVVRCRGEAGVHFLRSDADDALMSLAGDWLTFFRFHHSRVAIRHERRHLHFDLTTPGHCADIHASFDLGSARQALPPGSRFKTLAEAQDFLVELFAAFAHDPFTQHTSRVRIKRGEWKIAVVDDRRAHYPFMQDGPLFPAGCARLDSIFYVKDLPYYWHTLERVDAGSAHAIIAARS